MSHSFYLIIINFNLTSHLSHQFLTKNIETETKKHRDYFKYLYNYYYYYFKILLLSYIYCTVFMMKMKSIILLTFFSSILFKSIIRLIRSAKKFNSNRQQHNAQQ